MAPHAQWHTITRTRLTMDADKQRTASGMIANQLRDTILLLIRNGHEPVTQYTYGDTTLLRKAGQSAGFEATPLPDNQWPHLPEAATRQAHPLIPWRARLNEVANMERLRSDSEAIRTSLESIIPPDSYLAINCRPGARFETPRARDWVAGERNSNEDSSVIVRSGTQYARVSAGCPTQQEAKETAEQAGRILCDNMSDMSAHTSRPRLGLLATSLAISIIWTTLTTLSPLPTWALLAPLITLTAGTIYSLAVSILAQANLMPQACALTALTALIITPNLWALPLWMAIPPWCITLFATVRWWRRDTWDDVVQRARHWWWFEPKRPTRSADRKTRLGGDEAQRDGHKRMMTTAYPTQRTTLIIPPATVAALYTPIGDTTAKTQQLRPVPDVLAQGGVYVGCDQTGRAAYVQPSQLYGDVAITGEAGSGKSVMVHGFMQWAALARDHTDKRVWGKDTRIIDFAMKDDDGVHTMQRFRQQHWPNDPNRRGRVSYLADPNTVCIDLLGMLDGLDARATGQNIAASMQYSFNQGDIMNDSLDVITSAMTIAVAAMRYDTTHPGTIVSKIRGMEQRHPGAENMQQQRSPIGWCLVALAASDGQTGSARALGQVLRALSMEYPDSIDLRQAAQAAEQLYGRPDKQGKTPITDQRLLDKTRASANKVRQFMDVEHVFTPRRARLTWGDVLDRPGDYHFVFAPHDGYRIPAPMDRILGAWMLHRLCDTIMAQCQGWEAAGKHTMIVCDELSMLSSADDSSLAHIKDQMRSFGVIAVFATQYPEQLSDLLLRSFMGYATFIAFKTPDTATAQQIAARLSDEEGADGWNTGAVMNLVQYQCAVRTQGALPGRPTQLQPTFLVNAHNFDADPIDRLDA